MAEGGGTLPEYDEGAWLSVYEDDVLIARFKNRDHADTFLKGLAIKYSYAGVKVVLAHDSLLVEPDQGSHRFDIR